MNPTHDLDVMPQDDFSQKALTIRSSRLSRRVMLAGAVGLVASTAPSAVAVARGRREEIVSRLLGDMELKERIAQLFLFQAEQTVMPTWYRDLLEQLRPGGIILEQPNIGTPDQIRRYIRAVHRSNKSV